MELLNFYSKILPDDLFEKKYNQREKSIEKAFKHVVNQHVKESKIKDDSWVKQFELASYNNNATPTNLNIDNMKYTNVEALDFNYNIVKEKDFKHNNMFHNRGGYTIIQGERIPQPVFSKNPIIENFLGNSYDRIPIKQEVPNMFKPEEGIFQGASIQLDLDAIKNRYVTSDRRNDALLTDPQRVPPGLGRSAHDNSQRGLHPLFRVLPRNVDDIRNANHQRVSYKNQITPGQYLSKSPVVAPFEKRTADTFMVDRPIVQGRSQYTEHKQEGEYNIQPTARDMHNIEYKGPVYSSSTYNKNQRLAYTIEEPNKNEYVEPDPVGVTLTSMGHSAVDYFDIPRDTVKQTTLHNPAYAGITLGSNVQKTQAYDPNDLARDTIRQTTLNNPAYAGVSVGSNVQRTQSYDPNDLARDTTRQTTFNNPAYAGVSVGSNVYQTQAYDPSDLARDTIKQTTLYNPEHFGTTVSSNVPKSRAYDPSDLARDTIKQTTLYNPEHFGTIIGSTIQKSQAYDPRDVARDTIKQTTIYNPEHFGTIIGSNVQKSQAYDPSDLARDTIKQTTLNNPAYAGTAVGSNIQKSQSYDPSDLARNTIRQTTSHNPAYAGAAVGSNVYQTQAYDPSDLARDTVKQTTTHNPAYAGITVGSNVQQPTAVDYNDNAKETQRQISSVNKSFNQGGSNAQNRRSWVAEEKNITIRDCRNEIYKKEEKHYPTQVSLAHIPQINTQGSFRLPIPLLVTQNNHDIIPNSVQEIPCLARHKGSQANHTPSRELTFDIDRTEIEVESNEFQRNHPNNLSRYRITTQHDVFSNN
jgi:hypothetical protein